MLGWWLLGLLRLFFRVGFVLSGLFGSSEADVQDFGEFAGAASVGC